MIGKIRSGLVLFAGAFCALFFALSMPQSVWAGGDLPISELGKPELMIKVTPETIESMFAVSSGTISIASAKINDVPVNFSTSDVIMDFQGDFSKGNIKQIVVDVPVTITSSNRTAKFSQVNFITTSNAVIQNLSVSMDRSANSMEIPFLFTQSSGDLVLQNNTISYITGTRFDSYAIYVSPECKLLLDGNVINFTGNSDASKRCKVLYAFTGTVEAVNNTFKISLPSIEPAETIYHGSETDAAYSEGFFFRNCPKVRFENNIVDVSVNGIVKDENGEILHDQGESLSAERGTLIPDRVFVFDIQRESDSEMIHGTGEETLSAEGEAATDAVSLTGNQITVTGGESITTAVSMTAANYTLTGNKIDVTGKYLVTGIMVHSLTDDAGAPILYGEGVETETVPGRVDENKLKLSGMACSGIGFSGYGATKEGGQPYSIAKNEIKETGAALSGIDLSLIGACAIRDNSIDVQGAGELDLPTGVIYELDRTCGIMACDQITSSNAEITGNQILSTGWGIYSYCPGRISGNNVKTDGLYAVNAYKDERFASLSSGEDGEKAYLLEVTGNTLRSKSYKGNESVFYDPEKVLVKDNDDYAEPAEAEKQNPGNQTTDAGKDKIDTPAKSEKTAVKLSAKAKKFDVNSKSRKYVVTLKDASGKAIAGAKITLKIKKKTFKAKTNKKGKATFKLKSLKKKGKYKATVKYKGNKSYQAASKKVKITVN